MKKKNSPITLMIGIVIFLVSTVFVSHQLTQSISLQKVSNNAPQGNFFQTLATIFGFQKMNFASNESPDGTHPSGQYASSSQQLGNGVSNHPNQNSFNSSAANGSTGGQDRTNAGNNSGDNADNNLPSGLISNAEYDNEKIIQNPSEINAENNSNNNQGVNPDNGSENNNGNTGQNNAENNQGGSPDNYSGGNSGNMPEGASGNNPEGNTGNNPGAGSGGITQFTLPTINPIPTDDSVSQSLTQHNQQNEALAALLATRKALVAPAQEQSQTTKNVAVNPQTIPAPVNNPPTEDLLQKLKSHQVTFH